MTNIKVMLGVTKNLGNFESLRLDAEYSTDLAPLGDNEKYDLEAAYAQAWEIVDNEITKKLEELEAENG